MVMTIVKNKDLTTIITQLNLNQWLRFQAIIKNENICNELEGSAELFWLYTVYLNCEGIYDFICRKTGQNKWRF